MSCVSRLSSVACLLGLLEGVAFGQSAIENAPEASTSTVEHCVQSHERAHVDRVAERWLTAREATLECAAASCPLSIRADCRAWLTDISNALPTLLVMVEKDANARDPVALELDGQPLQVPEPLGPIEVLPGTHVLRATLSGHPVSEQRFETRVGEKNQLIRVRFEPAPKDPSVAAPNPQPALAPPRNQPESRPRGGRPVRAETYWLSGGALVAFGVSGALLGSALSSLSAARDSCAPACRPSVEKPIKTRLLLADAFGGSGVVLLGFAAYTYFARPSLAATPAAYLPDVSLSATRLEFSFSRRF
jgi:hypothetical protein